MKIFKIIQIIGYVALFFASIFALVNSITEKIIFNEILMLCLFIFGIGVEIISIVVTTYKSRKSNNR